MRTSSSEETTRWRSYSRTRGRLWRLRGMTGTLVLARHGEIVRPAYTSNFDRAPLSERGEAQIRALASAWPVGRPTAIFASPLRRSLKSAILLAQPFRVSIAKRPCLKEWSADDSGIPQAEFKELERRAWADF